MIHQSVVISLCLAKLQNYKFSSEFKKALECFVDKVESIKAVKSNFNLFSLPRAVSACAPNPRSGIELQLFLVSPRREDTVALATGPLEFEGPAVPGTANTETPVRQHLDVSQVERTASVRTPGGRG